MNLWRRFIAWFAQPDPFDIDFPQGTQPIPTDFFIPGDTVPVPKDTKCPPSSQSKP